MTGKLYICATPIGNLEDITLRVIRTLKEVDLIACEDTRTSLKLCRHFDIKTPLTSYHEHNKYEKAEVLVREILAGKNIALISDAGTPGISDPGEELVRQAHEAGIEVTSLPGAAACITALTMSGLPTRRFSFEAFLPYEKKERRKVLDELKNETRTIVLYEAPHKLKKTLAELLAEVGNRRISIMKELTKVHETVFLTTLQEAVAFFEETEPKGEYVLVIEGRKREDIEKEKQESFFEISLLEHFNKYIKQGIDRKDAMKQVAIDRGIPKREVYRQLLEAKEDGESDEK